MYSTQVFSHLSIVSQNIQRTCFDIYNRDSQMCEKVKEPAREPSVLCQFFCENHRFFEVFELTRTSGCLILIFYFFKE
jgi:hypothetical protein